MINKAIEYYGEYGIDFSKSILTPYLIHGHVVSSPEMLLLFRPANAGDVDDWHPYEKNCWFVEWASGKGKVKEMIANMPYKLPFTSWYRGFKSDGEAPRVYNTDRILKIR